MIKADDFRLLGEAVKYGLYAQTVRQLEWITAEIAAGNAVFPYDLMTTATSPEHALELMKTYIAEKSL